MVFPKAIAILIPTLATVYCLPFAVSISMDPQTQNFEAGHFSSLALELGGNGLQWMLFGGSLACFIGLYLLQATLMSTWGFFPAVYRPLRTVSSGLGAGFLRTGKKRAKMGEKWPKQSGGKWQSLLR